VFQSPLCAGISSALCLSDDGIVPPVGYLWLRHFPLLCTWRRFSKGKSRSLADGGNEQRPTSLAGKLPGARRSSPR
jgi:hypothetical protein